MKRGLLIPFLAGLAIIAIGVGWVFYAQRGQHLQANGSILKTRSLELEKNRSLLVLDARVFNDSDVTMTVRSIEVSIETADGSMVDGVLLSPGDLKSTFQYNPLLGEQYNQALGQRDTIGPRAILDRTIAASFETPLADLDQRKRTLLRIEDQSGPVAEISGR